MRWIETVIGADSTLAATVARIMLDAGLSAWSPETVSPAHLRRTRAWRTTAFVGKIGGMGLRQAVKRRLVWGGGAAVVVWLLVLAVFRGWDTADPVASVVGATAGVLALAYAATAPPDAEQLAAQLARAVVRAEQREYVRSLGGDTGDDPIEQEKAMKFNALLTNAVIFHNALDIAEIVRQLLEEGWEIDPEDLAHISPYLTEHIKRFGEYSTHELGIQPEAYDPKLDVDFTQLRDQDLRAEGFGTAA